MTPTGTKTQRTNQTPDPTATKRVKKTPEEKRAKLIEATGKRVTRALSAIADVGLMGRLRPTEPQVMAIHSAMLKGVEAAVAALKSGGPRKSSFVLPE
jgi:hypothetical protein